MSERELVDELGAGGVVALRRRPTFGIVCGLLCLVGFIQLVMVGVALANRVGETRVVEVKEDGDVKLVYIPTVADTAPTVKRLKPRSYDDLLKAYEGKDGESDGSYTLKHERLERPSRTSGVGIRPLEVRGAGRFLAVKNSRVEKLVEEAKVLHLSGDVVRAVLKLEEAEVLDADEPAIMYRRALIFEDMRNWERAGDEYDKLFALGPEVGAYYDIATDKIANGVQDAPDVVPFSLGNVVKRVSASKLSTRVVVPIRKLSEREVEPSRVEVRIFFYDIVDNKFVEPVPKQRERNIAKRWVTGVADWAGGVEESVEAVYTLPTLELADVHLFGERRYFGHVVELYYKGELMDQYAYPGRLHGIHAKDQYKQHVDPNMIPFDMPDGLDGLDGEGMLLPTLSE